MEAKAKPRDSDLTGEFTRLYYAEVDPEELPRALDPRTAAAIVAALKPLGFRWVSLDLEGYRTGSLNEVLQISETRARG